MTLGYKGRERLLSRQLEEKGRAAGVQHRVCSSLTCRRTQGIRFKWLSLLFKRIFWSWYLQIYSDEDCVVTSSRSKPSLISRLTTHQDKLTTLPSTQAAVHPHRADTTCASRWHFPPLLCVGEKPGDPSNFKNRCNISKENEVDASFF